MITYTSFICFRKTATKISPSFVVKIPNSENSIQGHLNFKI